MIQINSNKMFLSIAAALLLFSFGASQAETIRFASTFNSHQEVAGVNPNTPTQSQATAKFIYSTTTHLLSYKIDYSDLSGKPIMAHFHLGARGSNGPVIQTICGKPAPTLLGTCPISVNSTLIGTWKVPDNQRQNLIAGKLFVNIHTDLNPKGEIRGQLNP